MRRAAADAAADGALLVQDTSWAGYEAVPRAIVDGYATVAAEAETQAAHLGLRVSHVVVPVGVGCLAQAMVEYTGRVSAHAAPVPMVVTVEPSGAACLTTSLLAGALTTVSTSRHTMMAGLRCGTPTAAGWPVLSAGVSGSVVIDDDDCARAVRRLAAEGVDLGPCGAAPLAGLSRLLSDRRAVGRLGLGPDSVVLLVGTEGSSANGLAA